MSKNKSSDTLVKITHNEEISSLELQDRIDLLTNMLAHPTKSKRDTYVAHKLHDSKGNFNTDRWEYQLMGTAALTSIPVILIAGSIQGAMLTQAIEPSQGILLATGGIVLAEAAIMTGTNAYMTIKGSKMSNEIKQRLTTNLESLGYQITQNNEQPIESIERYQTNNERLLEGTVISTGQNKYIHLIEEDEFVAKISNLINQILDNPYPRFEYDIEELKQVATDWMAINIREYKRTGKKLDISYAPTYLYEALESEILSKINKTLKKVSK